MRDTKDMSLREYSREQLMEELKKAEKWYRIGAAKGDEYCIRGFGKKVHR